MYSALKQNLVDFDSDQERGEAYFRLQKWHFRSVILWIPFAIAVVAYSCAWANLFGEAGNYTNPADSWEACMTQSQYVTLPINGSIEQVFEIIDTTKVANQVCLKENLTANSNFNLFLHCGNSITCLLDVQAAVNGPCDAIISKPSVSDLEIPVGNMLTALSYVGIQSIIFSAAGLASLNRALRHPTWLPSTIALLMWFIFAMITYYTVSPILPVPNQTNATLLIFMIYGSSKSKYNELNGGVNQCGPAYEYLWVYLALVISVVGITLFNLAIAIRAESIKFEDNNRKVFESLKNTEYPLFFATLAMMFYVLVAFSKAFSSGNTLTSISLYTIPIEEAAYLRQLWYPTIWFPFQQPELDLDTVLYVASFMSVIRGYTIQSVSAFRLAFVTSLVYCISSYPGIIGAFEFYHYNNFAHFDSCYGYFLNPSTTAFFGYPDMDQAQSFCSSFRTAISGSFGLLVCMHGLVIATYFACQANEGRKSLVTAPFDTERYASRDGGSSSVKPSFNTL